MDKIEKFLKRLKAKEFISVMSVLEQLQKGDVRDLDLKKLVGHADVYRIRVGRVRIIFYRAHNKMTVLDIGRRSEKTYRDF